MGRWEDWQRTRHDPGTPPDSYQQALGRKMLGELMEGIKRGGLFQNKIRREFADGTVVIAQFDGTTPMVQVIAPTSGGEVVNPALISLWIPRGFVFVPGKADAPQGWGLPVRQQPGDTAWPFGAQNLAPGLDVTRWTAGGPAAQVLLTRDDTTHYPDERRQRLPIGYDVKEWRADMTWQPTAAAWHVVRPTFEGFDWTPDVRGARMALWKAVTTRLSRDLMALPFAGYYDDAQKVASLTATRGMDESQWPTSYQTTAQRATKDGARGAYYEARYANGTPQQLADALNPPAGKFQIDVGVVAGIMTATARDASDWIRCGNVFWHPDDPALPTLTWDGYPAQNLPDWLVQGGWTGTVGSPIFPLEGWHYEWRGQTRYVYSKNLYAMGRCIGVLPDTVIAAAIRKETVPIAGQPGKTQPVNRVVVITWRASDQFGNAGGIAYLWKFRVWCVDFDVTTDVPLHVTDVPVGAYDVSSNPTGWRACGTFNAFPASGSSAGVPAGLPDVTVWQMWRFNGAATRAVAACGVPPYAIDGQWPSQVCEAMFDSIGPDGLSCVFGQGNPATPDNVFAVDYVQGNAWAWVQVRMWTAAEFTYRWSSGGVAHDTDFTGVERVVERWILSARDGAMAFSGHFIDCAGSGLAAEISYKVRLVYHGVLVATDVWADTAGVYEPDYSSDNFLDRLNASFTCDRDGHYVMGYDLGTTAGVSVVYVSWPVCGSASPGWAAAAVSSYFGSRWLFDGAPVTFQGLPIAPMRAFPIGVC